MNIICSGKAGSTPFFSLSYPNSFLSLPINARRDFTSPTKKKTTGNSTSICSPASIYYLHFPPPQISINIFSLQ